MPRMGKAIIIAFWVCFLMPIFSPSSEPAWASGTDPSSPDESAPDNGPEPETKPSEDTSPDTDKIEGKVITKIEINGLKRQNPEAIKAQFQSKENTPYFYKTLQEDIQRLYATRQFTQIDWELLSDAAGVKIIIQVKENETVEQIKFLGFKNIKPKSLESELRLKPQEPLDDYYLNTDLRTIQRKYLEKGYYFAEVTSEKAEGLRGTIVIYRVREGPQVKINKIQTKGRTSFPRTKKLLIFSKDPILSLMETKPSHWYTSHVYNENELLLDLVRIENFYRSEGWLDVNAFIENLGFNDTKDKVTVIIKIEEGQRYYIKNIGVEGNTVIEADDILKELPLKSEVPYKVKPIMSAVRKIKTLYGKKGYIDCDVETRTHYPEEGAVDVTFHLNEGRQKYLEKVKFLGNIKTRDKVIRRKMLIHPGELMDYGKIETSRNRIGSTMYFQSIQYEIEDGSSNDKSNLLIEVEEAQTGMLQLGGGYSANYGFGGILKFSQNNFDITRLPKSFGDFFSGHAFAGGGQRFSIIWQPAGARVGRYGVSFVEPYFLNKPLRLGFDYSDSEWFWSDYDEKRTGLSFSLIRRFDSGWEFGGGPRLEIIDIGNIEEDVPYMVSDLEGESRLRGLKGLLALDKRDSWLFSSKGYRFDLNVESYGGSLSGDFNFTKGRLKGEFFAPLYIDQKKLIFNLIGRLGQVKEFGDSDSVPFFDRFYAGGLGTVRGFRFRTISPKENDIAVGGNLMGIVNMELTYPLYSEEARGRPYDIVRLILFFDAGNVQNEWRDFKWDSFRTSAGFGLRLYMGNIPLTFSVGYPIKRESGDDRDTLQIDIGFMY